MSSDIAVSYNVWDGGGGSQGEEGSGRQRQAGQGDREAGLRPTVKAYLKSLLGFSLLKLTVIYLSFVLWL